MPWLTPSPILPFPSVPPLFHVIFNLHPISAFTSCISHLVELICPICAHPDLFAHLILRAAFFGLNFDLDHPSPSFSGISSTMIHPKDREESRVPHLLQLVSALKPTWASPSGLHYLHEAMPVVIELIEPEVLMQYCMTSLKPETRGSWLEYSTYALVPWSLQLKMSCMAIMGSKLHHSRSCGGHRSPSCIGLHLLSYIFVAANRKRPTALAESAMHGLP